MTDISKNGGDIPVDEDTGNVVRLHFDSLYTAKSFSARTGPGEFSCSGTLCGHIDLATPEGLTYPLSPDEVFALIHALQNSREDVLQNSRPLSDPRIIG